MFAPGAARGAAHAALARAYRILAGVIVGVSAAERYGIGPIQPDNVAQFAMDEPPNWHNFIPIWATIDAYRAARSCHR